MWVLASGVQQKKSLNMPGPDYTCVPIGGRLVGGNCSVTVVVFVGLPTWEPWPSMMGDGVEEIEILISSVTFPLGPGRGWTKGCVFWLQPLVWR